MAANLRASMDRRRAHLALALNRFFHAQARRVIDRLTAGTMKATWQLLELKIDSGELLPDDEMRRLAAVIIPILQEQYDDSGTLMGDLVGADQEQSTADPWLQAFLQEAGQHITDIHEATRRAVQDALVLAGERGYSPFQMAHGVPDDGYRGISAVVQETYQGRADTIARTELAIASQRGTHARYADEGVSEVEIIDGDSCGWVDHDDPDLADGSIRTLIDAEEYPIAHPNCLRISMPVLQDFGG